MSVASAAWFVIAAILILAGMAGAVLPVLPGVPLVFAGMLLAAWADHFEHVGPVTLVVLVLLGAVAMAVDFLAGLAGARRVGASRLALVGATLGTLAGFFFGLPGIVFGPFAGAVAGELVAGGHARHAAHVGLGTWLGLLFGTLAKLALCFTMLGVFVFAFVIG